MSRLSITLSAILTVISFFYIYTFSSFFKVTVWELVGRVSYYYAFETYVFTKSVDHLIIAGTTILWIVLSIKTKARFAIATSYGIIIIIATLMRLDIIPEITGILSLPVIILLLILNNTISQKFLFSSTNLVPNYLTAIGITIGIASIVSTLATLYVAQGEPVGVRQFTSEIYLLFSSFSPILLVLLVFSFPVKMIYDNIKKSVLKLKNSSTDDIVLSNDRIKLLSKIILLFLFMSLSASLVIIPHLKSINLDNKEVGVDTHYYVEWIGILSKMTSAQEFANQAFVVIQHGDRPFTLLLFFLVTQIVQPDNLSYAFDHSPIILGPALVLAVFFLTRELTSSDIAALFSAFLTAVSFHTLIGIYAGSYANWLALIVGYLSMIFLLRSLKNASPLNLVIFFVLLVTLLFTHIYTWTILTLVMGIFLLVVLKLKYYERKNVFLLLVLLSSSTLIDLARMVLSGANSGIGFEIFPPLGSELKLGSEQFGSRWSSLIDTVQNYYGSLFANFIMYGLGVYWLLRSRLKELSSIFLVTFLSIGIIPLFLGNWSVQSRVFYDIPFQIPAGIAMTYVLRKQNGWYFLIPIFIWLVAMSIIAVSNFYYIPPL